jgi:hypothetical protein
MMIIVRYFTAKGTVRFPLVTVTAAKGIIPNKKSADGATIANRLTAEIQASLR